jgi:hypothetical protein
VPVKQDWDKKCVPGALQPIAIDREQNVGTYSDPNVWMRHKVTNEEFAE